MSEQIDNSKYRKAKLKELILKLHDGESLEDVKNELIESLSTIIDRKSFNHTLWGSRRS
jgi:hypothetical protein